MKTIFLIFYFMLFVLAYLYKRKQSNNQIGGKIAYSKSLWLFYCIFSWFLFPMLLMSFPLGASFKFILLTFSLIFWTRGLIELYMLYKTKNWKPIYGISHNTFSFILLTTLLIFYKNELFLTECIHLIAILISLIFENYFAYFFQKYVGQKTQGEKAIWFANNEDPLFKTNIKITKIANTVLYLELLWFIIFY